MYLVEVATGELFDEGRFFERLANVSFPRPITEALVAPFGFSIALDGAEPALGSHQYAEIVGAEYIDGQWFTKLGVFDFTAEQIALQINNRRAALSVSAYQGRMALLGAGLLDEVEALIAAPETAQSVKIAWEYATEWRRASPMVLALAESLSLSDDQLDALFASGAQIIP